MSLDVMLEFTAGVLFIFLQINMRGQVIFCWSQVLIGKGWRNGCIVVLVLFRSILNTTLANPTQRFSGPSFFSCFRCHLFPFFFVDLFCTRPILVFSSFYRAFRCPFLAPFGSRSAGPRLRVRTRWKRGRLDVPAGEESPLSGISPLDRSPTSENEGTIF